MNIQAILCSFVLAGGAVMVCVTTRTADDDGELKGKAKQVVEYLGIALVVLGGLGYLFTIYEVIKRGHDKLSKGKMRKLEQQVHLRKETAIRRATELKATERKATELRADTLMEEERF